MSGYSNSDYSIGGHEEHVEEKVEENRRRGEEQLRAADRLIGAQAFVRWLYLDPTGPNWPRGSREALELHMAEWARRGGHVNPEIADSPVSTEVHPAVAEEMGRKGGAAYAELVELLMEMRKADSRLAVRPSEIEAVLALAELVRAERDDGDDLVTTRAQLEGTRDDLARERVQTQRLAEYNLNQAQTIRAQRQLLMQAGTSLLTFLRDRNLLRRRTSPAWAGHPTTDEALIHAWQRLATDAIEAGPEVPGAEPEQPTMSLQVEALRAELKRVTEERNLERAARADQTRLLDEERVKTDQRDQALQALTNERDDLVEQHATWVGQREDYRGALAEARREREGLRRTLVEVRNQLVEMRPQAARLVEPYDAVWDFLDWCHGKGWLLSTGWLTGPEDGFRIEAKPGGSAEHGLVEGWHWARHGQWEHARGQEPTEAPGGETEGPVVVTGDRSTAEQIQHVEPETAEPGSFAYEHGAPMATPETKEDPGA